MKRPRPSGIIEECSQSRFLFSLEVAHLNNRSLQQPFKTIEKLKSSVHRGGVVERQADNCAESALQLLDATSELVEVVVELHRTNLSTTRRTAQHSTAIVSQTRASRPTSHSITLGCRSTEPRANCEGNQRIGFTGHIAPTDRPTNDPLRLAYV